MKKYYWLIYIAISFFAGTFSYCFWKIFFPETLFLGLITGVISVILFFFLMCAFSGKDTQTVIIPLNIKSEKSTTFYLPIFSTVTNRQLKSKLICLN